MKKALFLFLVLSLLFISTVFAEISLRCEVDEKTIRINDELVYKLIVSSSEKNIPAPKPPAFSGFKIISQAQSSTVVFGQGSLKTLLVYTYILVPLQPGKFKIEPSTITTEEKTYTCEEIEIEVIGGRQHPPSQPQEKFKPLPEKGPFDSEGPQITL